MRRPEPITGPPVLPPCPLATGHFAYLAILLPLAGGFVCSFIDLSVLLLAWIPFTLGVASAALLRSWWAVLLAPIALSIGTLAGLAAAGTRPNDISDPAFVASLLVFVLLALLPATTGAAIGTPSARRSRAPSDRASPRATTVRRRSLRRSHPRQTCA